MSTSWVGAPRIDAIPRAQLDIEVVAEASDGEVAIATWQRLLPDVMLMDIRMPRLDGLEAVRRIVVDGGERCRIVILTTFALHEYVYHARRLVERFARPRAASGPAEVEAIIHTLSRGECRYLTRQIYPV